MSGIGVLVITTDFLFGICYYSTMSRLLVLELYQSQLFACLYGYSVLIFNLMLRSCPIRPFGILLITSQDHGIFSVGNKLAGRRVKSFNTIVSFRKGVA